MEQSARSRQLIDNGRVNGPTFDKILKYAFLMYIHPQNHSHALTVAADAFCRILKYDNV